MHCSDLERYLEAILDGRLGRGRTAVLRQHIAQCESCEARVEELRRFERDLRRRFRAMGNEESLWAHIDAHMVASEGATRTAERPPRGVVALKPVESRSPATETQESREMLVADGEEPGKPSFLHRLAPMAALVLMLGLAAPALIGVVEVLGLWRSEPDIEETYWLVASGKKMPSLRTEDSRMLQHWLAARLGYSVPAVPTAAGFPIIGGDIQTVDGNQMAMVAYGNESSPVLMFMRPADDIDTIKSGPFYSAQDGLNRVVWTSDGYTYEIISTLPGEKLHKLFEIQT